MKTMLELLIRLQEMRACCERTTRNPQLTVDEKAAARCFKHLVRDCLPAEVLIHYDRIKESESEMLRCPEVFAMAVLVSTYRNMTPRQRRKLVNHYVPAPQVRAVRPRRRAARPAPGGRRPRLSHRRRSAALH